MVQRRRARIARRQAPGRLQRARLSLRHRHPLLHVHRRLRLEHAQLRRHLEAAGRRPRQRPVHGRRALVRLLGRRRCAGRHQRARQHRSRLRLDADAGRLQDRTTPPAIHCSDAEFVLNQPASVQATATDATSGPATATVSAPAATDRIAGSRSRSRPPTSPATPPPPPARTRSATASASTTTRQRPRTAAARSRFASSSSTSSTPLSTTPTVTLAAGTVTNLTTGATFVPTSPGAHSDVTFQHTGAAYTYRLKTSGYPPGSYTLGFFAGTDPDAHVRDPSPRRSRACRSRAGSRWS